jgi:hypothetical protein
MGNDISKRDNLLEDFEQKTNIVVQQLDNFFGPIDGYNLISGGQKKTIKSIDESYRPEFSQEIINKIKNERQVCNNIVGVYKNTLEGLLKDKVFNQKINTFIKNKKLDAQKFDINIRFFEPKIKDEPSICERVLEYYWMKYLVFRMLRNIDPLAEEYALIEKFTQSNKWKNLDKNYQEAMKIKKELDQERDKVRSLINENITKLLQDDLTYNDLMKLYKNLIEDKKLQSYLEHIYNICENISDLESSSNPDSYKFTKRGKLKGINLQNYKQIKICERLKSSQTNYTNVKKIKTQKETLSVSTRTGLPKLSKIDGVKTSRVTGLVQPKSILKQTKIETKPTRGILKNTTTSKTSLWNFTEYGKVKNKANDIRESLDKNSKRLIDLLNKKDYPNKIKTIKNIEKFKKKELENIKQIEEDKNKDDKSKLDLLKKKESEIKTVLDALILNISTPTIQNNLKKSTDMKRKTEANLDNLEKNVQEIHEDLFLLGQNIDEDYDKDWIRHGNVQTDLSNRLKDLQLNILNLRNQNLSDYSKQQAIDTYIATLNDIIKEYKKHKIEVLNATPNSEVRTTSGKSVRFA